MNEGERLRRARVWIVVFMGGLMLAGLTAFPLVSESGWLVWWASSRDSPLSGFAANFPSGVEWARHVHAGLVATGRDYPFLAYGTDWLAFAHLVIAVAFVGPLRDPARNQAEFQHPHIAYRIAHLVIAVAFVGPLRDPVRNVWVLEFGLIACAGIIPLAAICGPMRGLPVWWLPIDMSFGLFGAVPLWVARRHVRVVERGRALVGGFVPAPGIRTE